MAQLFSLNSFCPDTHGVRELRECSCYSYSRMISRSKQSFFVHFDETTKFEIVAYISLNLLLQFIQMNVHTWWMDGRQTIHFPVQKLGQIWSVCWKH